MGRIVAINGSPRKSWNTATLIKHALDGAKSQGAKAELVHIYNLDFKGCTSCFSCKQKDGKSYGRCGMFDGLTPILDAISGADGLILGSPIYFGCVTGEMRSFMERLLFPNLAYTRPLQSLFGRTIPVAFIYTMNVSEEQMRERYAGMIAANENSLKMMFGKAESLCCFETLQFEDYDLVVSSLFDPEKRRERHRTVFLEDCRRAYEMGVRMVGRG